MFGIFKRQKTKPYNWKTEQTRLWESLVPSEGQADTLQGELIRVAGKLTDQAFRNGNMNWDAEHEKLWRFVFAAIAMIFRQRRGRDPFLAVVSNELAFIFTDRAALRRFQRFVELRSALHADEIFHRDNVCSADL